MKKGLRFNFKEKFYKITHEVTRELTYKLTCFVNGAEHFLTCLCVIKIIFFNYLIARNLSDGSINTNTA